VYPEGEITESACTKLARVMGEAFYRLTNWFTKDKIRAMAEPDGIDAHDFTPWICMRLSVNGQFNYPNGKAVRLQTLDESP